MSSQIQYCNLHTHSHWSILDAIPRYSDYCDLIESTPDQIKSFVILERFKECKTGKNNPSYGMKWIYNLELSECKLIKPEELQHWLDNEWKLGRIKRK